MMKTIVIGAVVLVALAMFSVRGDAADPPMFEKGKTYIFIWDCTPEYMRQLAMAATGGERLNPCFVERLTVINARKDGWVEVSDPADEGRHWIVNPARALATQLFVSDQRSASR